MRLISAVLLLLLTAAPAAWAADFDPTSVDWDGLNSLQGIAGLVDLQIAPRTVLDWSQVDEHDVLLVIAPQVAPVGEALESLTRFVESGGRLVVADDFGPGAAWLEPFGLHLEPSPGRSLQRYEGVDGLPLVTIDPDPASVRAAARWQARGAKLTLGGFLTHELHNPIVLNHPARLRLNAHGDSPLPVAWGRYDEPGFAWLAETDLGAGRVLGLADPSIWLNAMLERFHDNKQFAANVLRYYCVADRPCHVTLVSNATAVRGVFVPQHATKHSGVRSSLEQLAHWLKRLAMLLSGRLVAPALILAVILLAMVAILWQVRTPLPVVPPEPAPLRQRTALADTVHAWLDNAGADYRKPARFLATHLARRLGMWQALPAVPEVRPQALARMQEVLADVNMESAEEAPPLGRTRFGQLATEVEWAESLLNHAEAPVDAASTVSHPQNGDGTADFSVGWQRPQNRAS